MESIIATSISSEALLGAPGQRHTAFVADSSLSSSRLMMIGSRCSFIRVR